MPRGIEKLRVDGSVAVRERNAWVDYAKAIGIILVVYGHVARGVFNAGLPMDEDRYVLVDSIIYSFHMPLFFFLSGLFFYDSLQRRGKTGLIVNKIDTIIYPFVLWSLLQGGVEVALSNYTNGNISLSQVLSSLLWSPRAQFWFLYALFLVFVVCILIYAWVGRRHFLPVLLLFAGLYVFRLELPDNSAIRFIAGYGVFFTLGVWVNEFKGHVEARCVPLMFGAGVLFVVAQYLFHGPMELTWDVAGLPSLVLAMVSIFFVMTFSMWLGRFKIRWLLFVGTASMAIYLMHILAGSGLRVVMSSFLGINSIVVHLVLGTLMGVGLPLLAHWFIQRQHWHFLLSAPRPLSAARIRSAVTQG